MISHIKNLKLNNYQIFENRLRDFIMFNLFMFNNHNQNAE